MIPSLMPTYDRYNLTIERGKGCYVFDSSGLCYLDFGSGIAVNSLGHCHSKLVSALTTQASKLWHCSNLYNIPEQTRLADRLVKNTFADTVFFNNSGAEAIETGIKMIRKYHHDIGNPHKFRIITFEGAFHGRTLATISAGKQKKYITGFEPVVDGFCQVAFNDINSVIKAIDTDTGGILIEPIQGEGGIRRFSNSYLQQLRTICDEHNLLLMLDEVQTGIGRTGKLFAHEWADIKPDIVATAKGLGGGFPIGACLASECAGRALTAGSHGTTFGGNPMAMAAGNAVLDVILEEGFLKNVETQGQFFLEQLKEIAKHQPKLIAEVRGYGLMLGFQCRSDGDNRLLVAKLMEKGLLTVPAGDNVVRFLPPLIVSSDEIKKAITAITSAVDEIVVDK